MKINKIMQQTQRLKPNVDFLVNKRFRSCMRYLYYTATEYLQISWPCKVIESNTAVVF